MDLSIFAQNEFLIPFLFVLAIIFGVLRATRVFEGNVAVQMIIALALAYFAATYQPFVSTLFTYLPSITWFFIMMFFIVFILEVFGLRGRRERKEAQLNMIIYGVLLLLLFTIGIHLKIPTELPIIGSRENFFLLLGLLLIIAIFWYAYESEEGKPSG
jgi:hypothetical protein